MIVLYMSVALTSRISVCVSYACDVRLRDGQPIRSKQSD